ncbi:MAG TPA: peptidylprolyl isomerase, partial [Desulfitobacteriaceae bacterium]|nr:peptidylprolyl isomerase [Desulfitobacteriaceae bacterium]
MKKSLVGIVSIIFVMILAVSGCASSKWVAKVNGTAISLDQYNTRLNDAKVSYEKQQVDFTSEDGKENLAQLKNQILDFMIMNEIISQEVQKLGLKTDDPKVSEKETELKQNMGTEEQFLDELKKMGMTEPDLQKYLALNLKVTADTQLTDDEVKAYFDNNADKYGEPEQVRARHILVATEDEANQIIAQLKEGGNFEELAKEKSLDEGSKGSGGNLDFFARGQMVPEFEEAAFAQKVGEYSAQPVKTQVGYHIIFVEEHKQAVSADYAAVKDTVAKDAMDEKIQNYYDQLKKNANMEYA